MSTLENPKALLAISAAKPPNRIKPNHVPSTRLCPPPGSRASLRLERTLSSKSQASDFKRSRLSTEAAAAPNPCTGFRIVDPRDAMNGF